METVATDTTAALRPLPTAASSTPPAPTAAETSVPVGPPPTRSGSGQGAGTSLSLTQILDATAQCLAESGYDGTTIRRIAARLNCAVGSIYRYCTDKRALLSAVTQRRFEPVTQAIDDHVSVAHTAAQYAAVAGQDPQQYRLMFWLASMAPDARPTALPAIIQRIIDGWTRQVGDPLLARRLWMLVHGSVMLNTPPDTLQAQVQELLDGRGTRSAVE